MTALQSAKNDIKNDPEIDHFISAKDEQQLLELLREDNLIREPIIEES